MIMTTTEKTEFRANCRNSLLFCAVLLVVTVVVAIVLPAKKNTPAIPVANASHEMKLWRI